MSNAPFVTQAQIDDISIGVRAVLRRHLQIRALFARPLDFDFLKEAVRRVLEFSYDVEVRQMQTWLDRVLDEYDRVHSSWGDKSWQTIQKLNELYQRREVSVEDITLGKIVLATAPLIKKTTGRSLRFNEEFQNLEGEVVTVIEFVGVKLNGYADSSWRRHFGPNSQYWHKAHPEVPLSECPVHFVDGKYVG